MNPDSYFLRFPDIPTARIIALPARVRAERDVAGIKWISSFPANHDRQLPRASAVIILNAMSTGFPYACIEGSHISAARTAGSAALAAEHLHGGTSAGAMAVIGAGPIAATVVDFLLDAGWRIGQFRVHDLVEERAARFCARLRGRDLVARVDDSTAKAMAGADLILFATTAAAPYLNDPDLFTPAQTVLHLSLRDLGIPVILSAQNIVDDVEHCLKAQTSVHLASQATGGRAFIDGTISDLLAGRVARDTQRVRVFSPFGLGALDIMLARSVFEAAAANGYGTALDEFLE